MRRACASHILTDSFPVDPANPTPATAAPAPGEEDDAALQPVTVRAVGAWAAPMRLLRMLVEVRGP